MEGSEVQRVLAQIDAEAKAAQLALYGLAQVNGHAFMLKRQEEIANAYVKRLEALYYKRYPEEKGK